MIIESDSGLIEIRAIMETLLKNTRSPRKALNEVGDYFVGKINNQFEQEVDPWGRRWHPLASSTIAQKQTQGAIMKILQRTGNMKNAVNYTVKDNDLTLSVNDPKAIYHQYGTSRMPKREILGISPQDEQAIRNILQESLTQRTH